MGHAAAQGSHLQRLKADKGRGEKVEKPELIEPVPTCFEYDVHEGADDGDIAQRLVSIRRADIHTGLRKNPFELRVGVARTGDDSHVVIRHSLAHVPVPDDARNAGELLVRPGECHDRKRIVCGPGCRGAC